MKKKIFSIFLVMVLCIGMTAGCKKNVGTSQDNAIAEEDDDSKEEAKSYRFGLVVLPWKIHTILHLSRH